MKQNASKVRELRIAQGVTLTMLAEVLGCNEATAWKKETGVLKFSIEDAKKISKLFGRTIEEIF